MVRAPGGLPALAQSTDGQPQQPQHQGALRRRDHRKLGAGNLAEANVEQVKERTAHEQPS